jgi:transketolase
MFTVSVDQTSLTEAQLQTLRSMWRRCVRRIVVSTTLAGSGHPGGSMSSLHLLLLLYSTLRHRPDEPTWPDRDRLLVSMGHISPGVYSVLAEFGYVDEEDLFLEFRQAGSSFAGHVEHCVPGVEWNTGNLGQGLSAAAGMALALKLKDKPARVVVLMGDGEQQKGQIAEARRFAVKYRLGNLIGIVDRNHLQIGGDTDLVMPQKISAEYFASRWNVLPVEDGHDFEEAFQALRRIHRHEVNEPLHPTVIVARTVMGKGVSFMEHQAKFHGSALSDAEAARALEEIGCDNPIPLLRERRQERQMFREGYCAPPAYPSIEPGEARVYAVGAALDNRSAYGNALEDLAKINNLPDETPKILGFSCDLEGSVKMTAFRRHSPQAFFEAGIQEHHTATCAGALSKEEFAAFFSTFGVFGVSETYNQHRLNDINQTQLKLVCTHLGLDVGEDGQTHQCIDYLGLLQNLFGFSVLIPADPNQTDRIIRYVATRPGNFFVGMGRSKLHIIASESGAPFFADPYEFRLGRADVLRSGRHGAFLSYGAIIHHAVQAHEELKTHQGVEMAVVNFASLKPLDRDAIVTAARTGFIITAEDHHVDTGLGIQTAGVLASAGSPCRLMRLGVKHYGTSGRPEDLYRAEGIDCAGLVDAVLKARARGWLTSSPGQGHETALRHPQ